MAAALHSSPVRERWVIDASQRAFWEEQVRDAGLDTAYVQSVLESLRQVSIVFGEVSNQPIISERGDSQQIDKIRLWEDEQTAVCMAQNPRVRNHIWVELKRSVETFSEVTAEEMVALRATVAKVYRVLRAEFGRSSAVIAQWNQKQAGHDAFTIEMIPPANEPAPNVLDVLDKAGCNAHLLFRGKYAPSIVPPTKEEVSRDADVWKIKLSEDLGSFSIESESRVQDWTQVQVNRFKSGIQVVDWLYQTLVEKGLRIERESVVQDSIQNQPIETQMRSCAFCLDTVIQNQLIFQSDTCNLIYNFKPSTPGGHFLIVPKRHLQKSDQLRPDEVKDMHRVAQKLVAVLKETTEREDIHMYIQDGPSVGQTVAHSHMHLLWTPNPLKYAIHSINYEREPTYTREQMMPYIKAIISQMNNSDHS